MRPIIEGRTAGFEAIETRVIASSAEGESIQTTGGSSILDGAVIRELGAIGLAGATPEQVLLLLGRRLRDLDTQLQELTAGMEIRNARIEEANDRLSVLGDVRRAIGSEKGQEALTLDGDGKSLHDETRQPKMPGGLTVRSDETATLHAR